MEIKNETIENQKKASLKKMKAELQDERKDAIQGEENIQLTVIGKIKKFNTKVKTSVLTRSKRAEKWHKDTAVWPLKRLARVNRFEQVAGDMIAIEIKAIGHGYDLMRTLVTKVDDIADEILTRAEKLYASGHRQDAIEAEAP